MTNMSSKVIFSIAIGLLALTVSVNGLCATCSPTSYAACINLTAFNPCYDGVISSDQIISCPEGTICTDTQGVCSTDLTIPGCDLAAPVCGDCNSGLFTCLSQTQIGFCKTDGTVGAVASCENGKVCSMDSFNTHKEICALSCLYSPTCSNTEPLPPPVKNIEESCTGITKAGYYTNVADPTCKTYVYCEEVNTVMTVLSYTCTTGYFDGDLKKCSDVKPATCT